MREAGVLPAGGVRCFAVDLGEAAAVLGDVEVGGDGGRDGVVGADADDRVAQRQRRRGQRQEVLIGRLRGVLRIVVRSEVAVVERIEAQLRMRASLM